jgi:phage internal scaffolding protein
MKKENQHDTLIEQDGPRHVYRRANGSIRVATINNEPTKTQQQFADEVDVNNIMRKYQQTGELHHLNLKAGRYEDLTGLTDYQEMLHAVKHAEETFNALPSDVRNKFDNNPQQLIDFLGDSNNRDEAIRLGLVNKTQTDPILSELQNLNKNLTPKESK